MKYADWRDSQNLQMHHPTALPKRQGEPKSCTDDSLDKKTTRKLCLKTNAEENRL